MYTNPKTTQAAFLQSFFTHVASNYANLLRQKCLLNPQLFLSKYGFRPHVTR